MKSILLASGACAAAFALPAHAQVAGGSEVSSEEPIIVTGSRIVRPDYSTNSPSVSVDQGLLQNSATAALESNLNKLPQFVPAQTPTAGQDIQPTATNTPGAATIALRGIGSNRNLVLVDGRRSTPSNASGVIDISTIPSAAIQRVEIISGGASATYGADAVAGVTNFIMKKNVNGLELDAQAGLTQEGDGFEYQISGIVGSDFDDGRGNVSFSASMNTREASYQRDRKWYRDLWANPDVGGNQYFIEAPGIEFDNSNLPTVDAQNAVFPGSTLNPNGFVAWGNPDGTPFVNDSWRGADGQYYANLVGYKGVVDGYEYKVSNAGTLSQNNTSAYLILPLTRYNFFTRANYEINDWIGVFGQGLFSHTSTYTRNEPGPISGGWGVSIDRDSLDRSELSEEYWQLLDSRTRPVVQGEAGYIAPTDDNPNPVQPRVSAADAPLALRAMMPEDREGFTDVMTYNLLAGLEGSIPGTTWTWDASVNHGLSVTNSRQTGIYSLERLRTVMQSGNFGRGFSQTGNVPGNGFGAATATCTSGMNFFQLRPDEISQDCLDATRADLKNRSSMRQTIVEANLQGKIVDLPAGELRGAFGASYREQDFEFINDTLTTQGMSFLDQALGIYPSADSFGYYDVKEAYGELLVPILSDSFVKSFSLELGGRVSDYSTTGTSYTYKILGDLEVNDWLRFRGGFNRAERSPNIGELYLASQETFGTNNAGDPCSLKNPLSWTANQESNPANANNVLALCRELMARSGAADAADEFYSSAGAQSVATSGFAWPTLRGNANLSTEKANTWTAGAVISSPATSGVLSRLRLSVDFYDIKVTDAIAPMTVASVLQQCFDVAYNPAVATSPTAAADFGFCNNVKRNQDGTQGSIFTTYANSGRFHIQGIDTQLDWSHEVGPGVLSANVLFNYQTKFRTAALESLPMRDFVGTTGTSENGLNTYTYEYKVFTSLNYSVDGFNLGLQWQHLPAIEDAGEVIRGVATPDVGMPAYNIFHLNSSYALTENVNLRFGVENLFNKRPPLGNYNPALTPETTGQLPGGGFASGNYDTNGRRFFVGANVKF